MTREMIARTGWIVALVGALLSAYAFFVYDPSIEGSSAFERINNNGLLQRQFMIFIFGTSCLVAGLVTAAVASVSNTPPIRGADTGLISEGPFPPLSSPGAPVFSVNRLAYAKALGIERTSAGFEYRGVTYPELEEAIAAANLRT